MSERHLLAVVVALVLIVFGYQEFKSPPKKENQTKIVSAHEVERHFNVKVQSLSIQSIGPELLPEVLVRWQFESRPDLASRSLAVLASFEKIGRNASPYSSSLSGSELAVSIRPKWTGETDKLGPRELESFKQSLPFDFLKVERIRNVRRDEQTRTYIYDVLLAEDASETNEVTNQIVDLLAFIEQFSQADPESGATFHASIELIEEKMWQVTLLRSSVEELPSPKAEAIESK